MPLYLRAVRKPPQIQIWREAITPEMTAIMASLHIAYRGDFYGLGVFVLIDRTSRFYYDWREIGRAWLMKEINEVHEGTVPWLRSALDADY